MCQATLILSRYICSSCADNVTHGLNNTGMIISSIIRYTLGLKYVFGSKISSPTRIKIPVIAIRYNATPNPTLGSRSNIRASSRSRVKRCTSYNISSISNATWSEDIEFGNKKLHMNAVTISAPTIGNSNSSEKSLMEITEASAGSSPAAETTGITAISRRESNSGISRQAILVLPARMSVGILLRI